MNIACIGGGPAGLYLGILVKRAGPAHQVTVYERNRPDETFGFGVVFSDATLDHLAAADPESHHAITQRFARWDDIEIQLGDQRLRSTGHGFCGLERKALLQILQDRARELGVELRFEHAIRSLDELAHADVIVASDGVASATRGELAARVPAAERPTIDVRPNRFVWLGTTVPYEAFTFLFKDTEYGLFRVHAYRYDAQRSTFVVECRDETWRAAGLAEADGADEDYTIAILERIFATELAGHRLIKNRSIWRNFPTVRCPRWHAGNVVLVGDAAHTAHFSIGSGTKLALEDAIVLGEELLARPEPAAALAAYEARRRPEVEALQAAAQASLEWFEGTERYLGLPPAQLTYSLLTRSLRVSHASVAKRDPQLARGVERLLAGTVGITADPPPPPSSLPFALGDRRLASRIAVAPTSGTKPDDDQLVSLGAAAAAGAGLVVTASLPCAAIARDEDAVAWARIVDYVHGKGACIALRLTVAGRADLTAATERAAFAGFDLLVLDRAAAATVAEIRAGKPPRWRERGGLAVVVTERTSLDDARALVRAGANLLWVTAAGAERDAVRLPGAPTADRLRNELRVATCLAPGTRALLPDLDAAIAAGRADLVCVDQLPAGARRA